MNEGLASPLLFPLHAGHLSPRVYRADDGGASALLTPFSSNQSIG